MTQRTVPRICILGEVFENVPIYTSYVGKDIDRHHNANELYVLEIENERGIVTRLGNVLCNFEPSTRLVIISNTWLAVEKKGAPNIEVVSSDVFSSANPMNHCSVYGIDAYTQSGCPIKYLAIFANARLRRKLFDAQVL